MKFIIFNKPEYEDILKILGEVAIPTSKIVKFPNKWIINDKFYLNSGFIYLQIKYILPEEYSLVGPLLKDLKESLLTKQNITTNNKMINSGEEEFWPISPVAVTRFLRIKIIEGFELSNEDNCDSFADLSINGKVVTKTKVINDTKNPKWNHIDEIIVKEDLLKVIYIYI